MKAGSKRRRRGLRSREFWHISVSADYGGACIWDEVSGRVHPSDMAASAEGLDEPFAQWAERYEPHMDAVRTVNRKNYRAAHLAELRELAADGYALCKALLPHVSGIVKTIEFRPMLMRMRMITVEPPAGGDGEPAPQP